MTTPFADRAAAGHVLAALLRKHHSGHSHGQAIVLALPRGGVPVGAVVATELGLPLDVLVVRKLGVPRQPELAMGAIAGVGEDVSLVRNESVLRDAGVTPEQFEQVYRDELAELRRREHAYRGGRPAFAVHDRIVLLVDDGLATGASMRAAAAMVRRGAPRFLVIAVPVAARQTCREMRDDADEIVCARTPEPFVAVGRSYVDFTATSDDEVRRLLDAAASAT